MVTQTVSCYHCGGLDLIRHGKAPKRQAEVPLQNLRPVQPESPGSNAYGSEFQARVLAAYHERCSLRGVCRIFDTQ